MSKKSNLIPGLKSLHFRFFEEPYIVVLEFNHGKVNEIGSQELEELELIADWIEASDTVVGLMSYSSKVSKSGKAIFQCGANVTERLDWSEKQTIAHIERQQKILERFRNLPLFHLCVVQGKTMGWGVEFCLTADFKLVSKQASFSLPETGLGIIPGATGTAYLSKYVGLSRALFLGMTGETLDAKNAIAYGLVDEIVEEKTISDKASKIMGKVATRSPNSIKFFKKAVLANSGQTAEERLKNERENYAACLKTGDAEIGRKEFKKIIEGQRPGWNAKT